MMKPFGQLQAVDVREYWESEPYDFTPWLAREENLSLLADTIGLDLELEAVEENIGPFRADIVAHDTLTNHRVLIENQLERTDHTHLGQLITYAAGLNAVSIVWIASRFTEEHRAALDWFNEITGEGINFFGLEIQLWRINESVPAPKFNMVSKPNNWTKSIKSARRTASKDLSDTKQLYLEYWSAFKNHLEENGQVKALSTRTPRPQHWYTFAIGRSGFQVSAVASVRDGSIGVQLLMTDEDAKAYFNLLQEEKDAIEHEIGKPLTWRELPEKKRSEISITREGVSPDNPAHWNEYHEWLRQTLETFYKVFAPRIKRLDATAYVPEESVEDWSEENLE